MTQASAGDTLRSTWEANGHFNPSAIPTQVKILFSPIPNMANAGPTAPRFYANASQLAVAAISPFASTETCYSATDPNTVCFLDWVIPTYLVRNSTYSFVYYWDYGFNPAGEVYTTCFDVLIV
ncbi:hypothetical protein AYI68_g578 [Smittium mucronatum]|uniref:Chitin-binding type-4 domain-containing protein n=1 Tax=Smittium mucronatum TaxID=133383 RepID=A0A1R0H7S8_9FUNG|nr:hypothetical protein AYI68_g578 [Smittium mucronatum]